MNIINQARKFAQKEIEKYGMPGPIAFEISENKAKELAEKLRADKSITLVGTYLMDIKLGQAFKEGRGKEHVKMSVEATKEFLEKFEIDEKTKEKIINCVEAHHGDLPYICKEAEICANADCYRFLHPKGFLVLFSGLGKEGLEFEEILNLAELKLDEKYKILSLDICKKELKEYYYQLKALIKSAREF